MSSHSLLVPYTRQPVAAWLTANCQRAANGYLRLQSHVLKRLPLPERLGSSLAGSLGEAAASLAEVSP